MKGIGKCGSISCPRSVLSIGDVSPKDRAASEPQPDLSPAYSFISPFFPKAFLCCSGCSATHCVDQVGFRLRSTCSCFPSSGIKGVYHCTWFMTPLDSSILASLGHCLLSTWSCLMKNENFSLPCVCVCVCVYVHTKLLSFLGPLPVADLCFSFCLSVSYGKQAPVIEVGAFPYY